MKAQEVNNTSWADIVFEKRNKAYGAYFIRHIYSKNVVLASAITIIISAFVLAFPAIHEFFKSDEAIEDTSLKQVKYNDLAPPPPIDKNVPPPPKMDVPPPVKTIIKFLPPKVTDKEEEQEEKMPTIDEVKQNDTGNETVEGDGNEVVFEEPVAEVVKEEGDEDIIFTIVEQQAEFAGGFEAMAKFLGKNMKYPAQARRMGVEGNVFVSFVIDKEGNISDPQVVKGISAECDKEALRVVKIMPPWKPGKQNGKAVRCRFVLPIRFKLAV